MIVGESFTASVTISVMRGCFTLTLFTVLIALTVRLIIVISELAALIIAVSFSLIESLFDCLHDICFLSDWIRVHSCFFDSECSLKFFKLENTVIVSAILNFFHKSRNSNIVFEQEFFDQKQACHSVLKELFVSLLIDFLNMIIDCCKV